MVARELRLRLAGLSVLCASLGLAQNPADELAQLRTRENAVRSQINAIRDQVEHSPDLVALKAKADAAKTAYDNTRQAQLDGDRQYAAALKSAAECTAKLQALGLSTRGEPRDRNRTLSAQEKAAAAALVKALAAANETKTASRNAVEARPEIAALAAAARAASQAIADASRAKLAAQPQLPALLKELELLQIRRRELETAQRRTAP